MPLVPISPCAAQLLSRKKYKDRLLFRMSRVKFQQKGVPGLRADVADVFHHFMRAGRTCVANSAESREPHLPSRCGRVSDDEHCSKFRSSAALNGTSCAGEQMGGLVRSRRSA